MEIIINNLQLIEIIQPLSSNKILWHHPFYKNRQGTLFFDTLFDIQIINYHD